jgi:hypothetical protein
MGFELVRAPVGARLPLDDPGGEAWSAGEAEASVEERPADPIMSRRDRRKGRAIIDSRWGY